MEGYQDSVIRRAVLETFRDADDAVHTQDLYREVARRTRLPSDVLDRKAPVGTASQQHNLAQRTARWAQQSLKKAGLITRVDGSRGMWRLTSEGRHTLRRIERTHALVAFSTRLGAAMWCDARAPLPGMGQKITLLLTSPPYALANGKKRAYGNPSRPEWIDFICEVIEQVLPHLAVGGNVALNIGTDLFEPGSPARSLLPERLAIALEERLGLSKMDTIIWHNPSKPPGPIQWASKTRQQLNCAYEQVHVKVNTIRRQV